MEAEVRKIGRARWWIRKAVQEYMFDSRRRIQMIDYGVKIKEGQELEGVSAIRFHVDEKFQPQLGVFGDQPPPVPKFLDPNKEFPTDVIEATYTPQQTPGMPARGDNRTGRIAPLCGGISISDNFRNTFGTLGCIVVDRETGEEMILSNWHVLVGNRLARPGQLILQPGRLDGGRDEDAVAELVRHGITLRIDAAVARLNRRRGAVNDQVGFLPIRGVARPKEGMIVVKSGRMTELTRGQIKGVGGVVRMQYPFLETLVENVMTVKSLEFSGPYSGGGDSGSVIIDESTQQAVGLHFAGNLSGTVGLAMDIRYVQQALNVDILTSSQVLVSSRGREGIVTGAGVLQPAG